MIMKYKNKEIVMKKNISLYIVLILSFFIIPGSLLFSDTTVTVNGSVEYQTTEGWGTSLCWFGNVIGGWSDSKRNEIADLLFDRSDGLGLNLIRYNIGGGDDPSHNHMGYGKEMEGFKASASSSYDWSRDANQRWVLQAAQSRIDPNEFIAEAFSNSPPYWMTYSGCASGADDGGNNLRSDYYDDFADYLTEVVLHFRDSWGITFRTLEPMNEPNATWWSSFGGQEGCRFERSVQDDIIREVKAKLDAKGLGTKIAAMDETGVDDTVDSYNSYDATTRSYIYQINTHVYSGSRRTELKNLAVRDGKKLWQSECDGSGASAPFDEYPHNHNDIVPGLDIAMRINRDMREMQPDGWIFWQAVESEQTQISLNKNWGLIHADFENRTEAYYLTKKYYTMEQYTKFIRPGYTMIDINNSDAVAFINDQDRKLVIVQRNATTSDVVYIYNLSGFTTVGSSAAVYRTSSSENFSRLSDISISSNQLRGTARGQSITTYVVSGIQSGGSSGEITTINDNTTGTGTDQFEYVGSWDYGSQTGAYNNDNHWNSDADDYYQIRFFGTRIEVYAATASNHGIAAHSIDGGSETIVDYYTSSRVEQALVYSSPVLAQGSHILKVRVTGTQNSNSSGASIPADMVRVINSDEEPPPEPGDVNNDGAIDIVDALLVAQFYVGLNPSNFDQTKADANCDQTIDIVDALIIAQYYVGLIESFC
jgi:O-glycosyl hydrolase